MADLVIGRLYRVDIFADGEPRNGRLGFAWVVPQENSDPRLVHTYSDRVRAEAGEDSEIDLYRDELDTAVEAETVRTPAKVWVELARWQLTK